MAVDIIGDNDVTRVSRVLKWSRERGGFYHEIWKGPLAPALVKYQAFLFDNAIDEVKLLRRNAIGILDVIIQDDDGTGGGQSTEEENAFWTIRAQDLWKPIRAHQTLNQDADQANLEAAREAFEKADGSFTATGTAATTYLAMLRRGQEEYVRTVMILEKRLRVGSRSVASASWAGVDQAWKLYDEANSPSPPSEILGVLDDHPEHDLTKKQWLKRGPNVEFEEGQLTYDIVWSWWFARQWSNTTYNGDSDTDNP